MDFLELARNRYSVRSFSDALIARHELELILRAGQLAPTACNRQPQRVLVIDGAAALAKLRRCTECHFNAPAALLVCCDTNACWTRRYDGKSSGDIDASIVATHMMLEAAQLGIGTTWVMYFDPEAIRREFALPAGVEPVALLVMGYPAADAQPSPMHAQTLPLDRLVAHDSF